MTKKSIRSDGDNFKGVDMYDVVNTLFDNMDDFIEVAMTSIDLGDENALKNEISQLIISNPETNSTDKTALNALLVLGTTGTPIGSAGISDENTIIIEGDSRLITLAVFKALMVNPDLSHLLGTGLLLWLSSGDSVDKAARKEMSTLADVLKEGLELFGY